MSSPVPEARPPRAKRRLLIAGAGLLVVAATLTVSQLRYLTWPAVEAEIVASRVVREPLQDRPGGPEYVTFRPEVTYRSLGSDGRPHQVTTFVNQWSKRPGDAERFLVDHPVGSQAKISTNPRDADQVKFDLGMNLATFWKPLALSFAAVLCGIFALLSRRRTAAA